MCQCLLSQFFANTDKPEGTFFGVCVRELCVTAFQCTETLYTWHTFHGLINMTKEFSSFRLENK